MRSLATSLFKHKRITTTLAKAKEARSFAETLLTKARKNNLHARRQIMSQIHDKEVVKELFGEIIQKVGERPGGYTRIIKRGNRKGDAASMAILELVDYNEVIKAKAEEQKEKRETKKAKKKEAAAKAEKVEEAKVVEEETAEKKSKKKSRKKKEE
jgi:large subunit ribosomal protein L17